MCVAKSAIKLSPLKLLLNNTVIISCMAFLSGTLSANIVSWFGVLIIIRPTEQFYFSVFFCKQKSGRESELNLILDTPPWPWPYTLTWCNRPLVPWEDTELQMNVQYTFFVCASWTMSFKRMSSQNEAYAWWTLWPRGIGQHSHQSIISSHLAWFPSSYLLVFREGRNVKKWVYVMKPSGFLPASLACWVTSYHCIIVKKAHSAKNQINKQKYS